MDKQLTPPTGDWVGIHAEAHPNRTAVLDGGTNRVWRYASLERRVAATAAVLADRGVESGDHLGVALRRSIHLLDVVFAAQRLGAVVAPLDVDAPRRVLTDRIDRFDIAHVVRRDGGVPIEAVPTTDVPTEGIEPVPDPVGRSPVDHHRWQPDDPMGLLSTSGTTGEPKGVVLTARNLWVSALASAWRLGVSPTDRWCCTLPPYHMGGLAPLYRSVVYGTAVVLDPEDGFDPERVSRILETTDATGISLVPTQLRRLLDRDPTPLAALRFVLLGGGPIEPSLLERSRTLGVPVHPTYGMTETTSQVATARPTTVDEDPTTVGHPLPFVRVSIRDEVGEPVEAGSVGEIHVAGPTVMAGYYGADSNAGGASDGPFPTGDLGRRRSDGKLVIQGRVDDRIISGGETVDPEAVRATIRSIEGVADVAVVGVPDATWGERVVAAVVRIEDRSAPNAGAIRTHCEEHLPRASIPKEIVFVDRLPRTDSGTVDRTGVRAFFET